MDIGTAYALASMIEWTHATDRVRLLRSRNRLSDAQLEYDPLAATCLGDLIYSVANRAATATATTETHRDSVAENAEGEVS